MSDQTEPEVEQTDPVTALTDAIDKHLDGDDQPGAPVGRVVEEMLSDATIDIGDVSHALKEAYFHGVVYQPSSSTVARVATDGGVDQSDGEIEQKLPIGVTNECDQCGAENISGQVHCAVCGGLINDV